MSTPDDKIRPIEWIAASQVHPHEAHDFTPWLSRRLDLIAEVIGLDEIELVGTEVPVGDYRLDILAEGQFGEERWPVAIENQYQTTDHRHLGQLITYLAQQEQGHAVWVVEDASDQHIAAMEFLNRTTVADFNYWVLRVRFTAAGDGFQVYFDVLARPNAFLKASSTSHGGSSGAGGRRTKEERYEFHQAILERLHRPLTEAGWRNVSMDKTGYLLRMRYPTSQPLSQWGWIYVRSRTDHYYVHILFSKGDETTNRTIVDLLQEHYGDALEAALPATAEVRWHDAEQSADAIKIVFRGSGYDTDPDVAAQNIRDTCLAWLAIVQREPLRDLDDVIDALTAGEAVD